MRAQYAVRHPLSPEPTVRFNDFAFGVHAWIFCVVVYSQFWPRLWGWDEAKGVKRHAGRITLGILCGSLLGVATTILIVLNSEGGGSNDGTGWAWLDVVSNKYSSSYCSIMDPNASSGLCYPIRQTDPDRLEIRPSSLRQLQEAVHYWMVHHTTAAGLQRWFPEHDPVTHRQLAASRLERSDGQPGQVWPGKHQSAV